MACPPSDPRSLTPLTTTGNELFRTGFLARGTTRKIALHIGTVPSDDPEMIRIPITRFAYGTWHPVNRRIVSGSIDVRMWDAATGKVISAVDSRSHYGIRALVKIGRPAVPALLRVLNRKA